MRAIFTDHTTLKGLVSLNTPIREVAGLEAQYHCFIVQERDVQSMVLMVLQTAPYLMI